MDSVDVEYERLAQVGEGTYGYFSVSLEHPLHRLEKYTRRNVEKRARWSP